MAGAYGKAGKHLALARRCVLDGRLTHPPDGKRRGVRGGGVWPACGRPYQGREPLAPALVRAARARRPPRWAGMSSYPLGRAGGAGPGICAPALAPGPSAPGGGSPRAAGLPGQAGGGGGFGPPEAGRNEVPGSHGCRGQEGLRPSAAPPGKAGGSRKAGCYFFFRS